MMEKKFYYVSCLMFWLIVFYSCTNSEEGGSALNFDKFTSINKDSVGRSEHKEDIAKEGNNKEDDKKEYEIDLGDSIIWDKKRGLPKIKIIQRGIKAPDGSALIVRTYEYANCILSGALGGPTIKQEMVFLRNGEIIRVVENPVRYEEYRECFCVDSDSIVSYGKLFDMMEEYEKEHNWEINYKRKVKQCSIFYVYYIYGPNGYLFCVDGSSRDNAGPELFSYYKPSGECVYLIYASRYGKIYKKIGKDEDVLRYLGVKNEDEVKESKEVIVEYRK